MNAGFTTSSRNTRTDSVPSQPHETNGPRDSQRMVCRWQASNLSLTTRSMHLEYKGESGGTSQGTSFAVLLKCAAGPKAWPDVDWPTACSQCEEVSISKVRWYYANNIWSVHRLMSLYGIRHIRSDSDAVYAVRRRRPIFDLATMRESFQYLDGACRIATGVDLSTCCGPEKHLMAPVSQERRRAA